MTGLNPDGLGVSRTFNVTNTERATIGPSGNSREWGDKLHLFCVVGQSNAEGKGDLGGGNQVSVNSETALQYNPGSDTITEPLADPFSDEDFGSAWPAFAQRYYQLTGVKSAYINSAVRGASLTAAADNSFGNFSSSGSLRSDATSDVNAAITKLESLGYDVEFRGFLWNQGEADAGAIDGATITRGDYGTELRNLVDYWAGEFSDAGVLWIFQTGYPDGGDTSGYHDVRLEQLEVVRDKTFARLASDIQQRFPNDGKMLSGEVHYDQAGLNEMGQFGAETIARGFNPSRERYRAVANFTGTQGVASGNFPKVQFDTETKDNFDQYDTGTYTYTAPSDGVYQIETRVTLNSDFPADVRCKIEIRVNDSVVQSIFASTPISDFRGFDVVAREELQAEDAVTVHFRHQDASTQSLYGDPQNAKFDIRWDALAEG